MENRMSINTKYSPRRRAFTLIEIMVVIGIIVVLAALLIPAVNAARNSAKRTATSTQMRSIALACESYYTMFNSYPGALPETAYGAATTFSSSQALVVSLTRAFYRAADPLPATDATASAPVAAFPDYIVSKNPAISPRDYSTNPYKTYDPFVNPTPAQLSTSMNVSAFLEMPAFVDSAYGNDALPILYYRAARKYDPTVSAMATVLDNSGSGVAAFYYDANKYVADRAAGKPGVLGTCGLSNLDNTTNLQALLFQTVSGKPVAKGAFVLISASTDRYYGADPKGNIDDIIVSGGN
jgi:prepilin-type N-terminal cleavage/methylation domain-containing protein